MLSGSAKRMPNDDQTNDSVFVSLPFYIWPMSSAIMRQWWLYLLFIRRGSGKSAKDSKRPNGESTGKGYFISLAPWRWMEWVRQSLGRSNGWLMVGLNNEATCNSGTDLSQNCHRIGEQPKRAKQLSFSATGSPQKCLEMHRHLLSHCRQANSHSFGRIKEIVPILAKELGGCVVWQNCSNIYVVSKYCNSIYVVSIPTFHSTAAAALYIIGLGAVWSFNHRQAAYPPVQMFRCHINLWTPLLFF